MIILHNGFTYLHLHGRIWLDRATQVTWPEWIAANKNPEALVWRYGQIESGFGCD